MKILKIGVTGSAGSGKSLVCKRLGELGLVTLDCDIIARQVVEPGEAGFKDIVGLFGSRVLSDQGGLDRARLRNILLNDPGARKKIESVLHPKILERMNLAIDSADYGSLKAVAVEVPLLFESGMDAYFDVTLAVVAENQALVERVSRRDGVSENDAGKMLALQMTQAEKMSRADHVIFNNGSLPELSKAVDLAFAEIQKEFLTT